MLVVTGWWYTYPSEKYEFVSWYYSSQLDAKIKFMFQTTNQISITLSKYYQNLTLYVGCGFCG
jgi:hypothetical protein